MTIAVSVVLVGGCSNTEITAGPGGSIPDRAERRPYSEFTAEGFSFGAVLPAAAEMADGLAIINSGYIDGKYWVRGEERSEGIGAGVLSDDGTMTPVATPPPVGGRRVLVPSGKSVLLVGASCSDCDIPKLEAHRLSNDRTSWDSIDLPPGVAESLYPDSNIWVVGSSESYSAFAVDGRYFRIDEAGKVEVLPLEKLVSNQQRVVCLSKDGNKLFDTMFAMKSEIPLTETPGDRDVSDTYMGGILYTDPNVRALDLAAPEGGWKVLPDIPVKVELHGPQTVCGAGGPVIANGSEEIAYDGQKWKVSPIELPAWAASSSNQIRTSATTDSGAAFAIPNLSEHVLERTTSGTWVDTGVSASSVTSSGESVVAFLSDTSLIRLDPTK
ncbi:MAG: hypothetical protein WBF71_17190 [Microthrixaceae bacterium]